MTKEGLKRKLAAILSADAVGYSRLMREDEEATVCDIAANRVFGKHVLSMQANEGWSMFYLSDDGKSCPTLNIFVPEFVN